MRFALILLTLLVASGPAAAQSFTWIGWFGQEWTDPAWGGYWTWDTQLIENGWGHQWMYWEDPAPHFPNTSSSVLIPDGAAVDTYGGGFPYCGDLTIGTAALLQIVYENLTIGGPLLQNNGRIELIAGGGCVSGLYLTGPLTLAGTGEILLAPGRFHSDTASITITVGDGQFIHGDGQFGSQPYGNYHGVQLTNHGHIQATSSTSPLDIYGLHVVNDGTVEATGGAQLRLWGDWTNTGGELLATNGGRVILGGGVSHPVQIDGGWLRTSGGGEIWCEDFGGVKNVVNEGTLHIRRYTEIHMADIITNDGLINQGHEGWAGWATIAVDSALAFLGSGVLRMGTGNGTYMQASSDHNALVTNGPDHTIESFGGHFGTPPDGYGDRRIALLNEGTIACTDAAYGTRFYVTGSGLENRGTITFAPAANANAEIHGQFRQTAGLLDCDDGLTIYDGVFAFTGGVLAGEGWLQGAVTLGHEAVIHPGGQGEIGTLDIYGNLTLTQGATLVCEWAHDHKDRLAVHGLLAAIGAITVRVDYVELDPGKGLDYVILECDEFDDQAQWTLELPDGWTSDGLAWEGNQLVIRNLGGGPVAVGDLPTALTLCGAAPNPFNPHTTVRFALDRTGPVRLWVADLAGRSVRTLVGEVRQAGEHAVTWDGCDDAGRGVGSGTYLCVLEASGERRARRMTLVR